MPNALRVRKTDSEMCGECTVFDVTLAFEPCTICVREWVTS